MHASKKCVIKGETSPNMSENLDRGKVDCTPKQNFRSELRKLPKFYQLELNEVNMRMMYKGDKKLLWTFSNSKN